MSPVSHWRASRAHRPRRLPPKLSNPAHRVRQVSAPKPVAAARVALLLPPSLKHRARPIQKTLFLQTQIPPHTTDFTFVPSAWLSSLMDRFRKSPPARRGLRA